MDQKVCNKAARMFRILKFLGSLSNSERLIKHDAPIKVLPLLSPMIREITFTVGQIPSYFPTLPAWG